MKILIMICARGGSKGVPNKNLRKLGGCTLVELAVKKALRVKNVNDVIISTDDPKIAEAARNAGAKVPFMRPAELASDSASKLPVFKHALRECEKLYKTRYDLIIDVDVTVPFLTSEDIENAVKLLLEDNKNEVVVAAYVAVHNPYFNMMEEDENGFLKICKKPSKPLTRRQDAPKVLQLTAGLLAFRRDVLERTTDIYQNKVKAYIMPIEKSVMIDTEIDFLLAQLLYKNGKYK